MKLETTFTYTGAVVTVRRETIRSRLYSQMIYGKFPNIRDMSLEDFLLVQTFAKVMTQVSISGDIGFTLAKPTDTIEVILASFEAFMDAAPDLLESLDAAFAEVNAAVNDPDLTPEKKV